MRMFHRALVIVGIVLLRVPPRASAQQVVSAKTCHQMDQCFVEWACRLPPGVPKLVGKAAIATDRSITGDRTGFSAGRESSDVSVRAALNLVATMPGADSGHAIRSLRFDLSHPADPLAAPLGIVEDHYADLHVWGATLARDGVEPTIQYLPVGATISSALAHFDFNMGGHFYLLQFGPEALGTGCNQGGTSVTGVGTTAVTVTRARYNRYVVEAPPGSRARLFDVTNGLPGAVDRGLYYASFRVVFDIADFRANPGGRAH